MPTGFQSRVRQVIDERYGSMYAYQRAGKPPVPKGTVMGWLRDENPSEPTLKQAANFADHFGVTLDWLVHGREPKRRGTVRSEVTMAADLRAHLLAALPNSTRERRFFEEWFAERLTDDVALLRQNAALWRASIEQDYRERIVRAREQGVTLLRERLAREPNQAKRRELESQISRAERLTETPPLLADASDTVINPDAVLAIEAAPRERAAKVAKGTVVKGRDVTGLRTLPNDSVTFPGAPQGTLGRGVLDRAAYRAEKPARDAIDARLSEAERAFLAAREKGLKAGGPTRRAERRAAQKAARAREQKMTRRRRKRTP